MNKHLRNFLAIVRYLFAHKVTIVTSLDENGRIIKQAKKPAPLNLEL